MYFCQYFDVPLLEFTLLPWEDAPISLRTTGGTQRDQNLKYVQLNESIFCNF